MNGQSRCTSYHHVSKRLEALKLRRFFYAGILILILILQVLLDESETRGYIGGFISITS